MFCLSEHHSALKLIMTVDWHSHSATSAPAPVTYNRCNMFILLQSSWLPWTSVAATGTGTNPACFKVCMAQ